MNDIIEKLRISKEKYPNEFDNLINASEIGFKSSIENRRKQLEYYREIEQQRNELLEALIYTLENEYSHVFDDDYILPIDSGTPEEIIIRTIEKTDPQHRSWSEIKELLS